MSTGAVVDPPAGEPGKAATPQADPEAGRHLPLAVVDRSASTALTVTSERRRGLFRVLRVLPLIPLLLVTGGVIGLYFQPPGVRKAMEVLGLQPGGGTSMPIAVPAPPRPPAGAATAERIVVGLGRILPEGEVITIAPPYGAGDARIASLPVKEGDKVTRGEVLALLDNEAPLKAAVDGARATVASREAALAQSRASVQASRIEAEAAVARAEATAENARKEYDRVEPLRRSGTASEATLDLKRSARDEALREVDRTRATLSRYAGDLDAQPDVVVAARSLDAARAELERAETDLQRSRVLSPIDGTVLTVNTRAGEKPPASGILNLGNLDRMTAEVEIYQTQIGRVDVGQPVEISAEALPRKLTGTVDKVGLEVRRQSLVDANPAANTDARVVRVTVALDPESSAIARRFTNLQVIARIRTGAAS
jgi:HlyD family secretion protein